MTPRWRRVAVLGHPRRPGVQRAAKRARQSLRRRGCEVRLDAGLGEELGLPGQPLPDIARWCQVMLTLGGDGTALLGARALAGRRGVLLPVNLGGLGFLAVAESGRLLEALASAQSGRWPVVQRRVVAAAVRRKGRTVHRGIAMNDIVVKGSYAAIHLRMHALGADLGHVVADGIIAASAAGSTAYSLSAGGPVMSPDLEALAITPVCPHTIASRPLVLAPGSSVTLKLIGSLDRTVLLFDGQESVTLQKRDEITLRLDRKRVRMVQNPDQTFADSLRRKLGWQGTTKRSM